VVLHHINLRFEIDDYDVAGLLPGSLDKAVFWSGYYSVITFFVISGFLITTLSIAVGDSSSGSRYPVSTGSAGRASCPAC